MLPVLRTLSLSALLLLLALLNGAAAVAQEQYTLRGRVLHATTGEALVGASLSLKQNRSVGAVTDKDGSFLLTAPAGSYSLVAQYLGFEVLETQVDLFQNRLLTLRLEPVAYGVREVEIVATRQPPLTQTPTMGEIELPMETIKTLPVLFGEVDILKTIQLMPGVKSGGEGFTGFYVRGGGADQNLVMLDEAVVYNSGHLLNFFSVFNSDAIQNSTLIKGNILARYGGRLSSVLDVSMREGSMEEYKAEGGIGLIASRLAVQGPLLKEKASFLIAARRTYMDAVMGPFLQNTEQGGLPYYFYDLNGKVVYHLTEKDKLYLSGYYGRDNGSFRLSAGRFDADFGWGNATASARWNRSISDRASFNVSAIYSRYDFAFNWDFGGFNTAVTTGVGDYTLKADFDYKPSVRHHVQYGAQYSYHVLKPRAGSAEGAEGFNFSTDRVRPKYTHEGALYVADDIDVTDRLLLSLGLRVSSFQQTGPYAVYAFDENLRVTDSVAFGAREKVKLYQALEPRFALRYSLSGASSLKAAFTRSAQYLHLVSNAYTTLPLDVWVPSSALVEPQLGTQYALGYFRNFRKNEYEASMEVYYKEMQNQLEYREGYAPGPSNRDLEYEFVKGSGTSYGAEFFMRKNYGAVQGWLGYTPSNTTRTFPDLNQGRTFPARYDRRHDASVVVSYKTDSRWTFGGSFVYGTGQATTLPVRRYYIEGTVNYQYGARNSFRMEPFHRLDLSATLEGKKGKKLQSSWTFSVYNVYGRRNPFLYYIDNEGLPYSQESKVQAKKLSIIPFPLPSATWNFSF